MSSDEETGQRERTDGPASPPPGTGAAGTTAPPDTTATWGRILSLAWPALAQQFLILLVGLSDQYLAGNYQAPNPDEQVAFQAAQTTANYMAWFVSCYIVVVGVGATALVARAVGAGDRATAVRATNQTMLLALTLGLVGSAAYALGLEELVRLLQLEGPAAKFAVEYMWPTATLLVFEVIEAAGIACLVGAGDTRTGLFVRGGVAVINLPLAWGLCYGLGPLPELGFVGIALGTALSHVVGCLAIVVVLARGRAGLWLRPGELLPDWEVIRRLLRVSIPAAVDSLSTAVAQLWFLGLVNQLGAVASSAHGIAIRWEALGYLSGAAVGTAATALVGQNLGARRPDEAARSGWRAFALGCAVMTLMGALFFVLAPAMFRLFCPYPEQRPVVEAGVPVLRLVAFAMPGLASVIVFLSALRGAGDTRVPVLFTWFGFLVVRIPLAYLLTRDSLDLGPLGSVPGWDLGLFGVWLAMFADLWVRGVFFFLRFAGGRWKRARV